MRKPDADQATGDFRRFETEGWRPGTSRAVGQWCCDARDAIARGLVAIGVTPNMLTIAGFVTTLGAAICFFLGGSHTHGALEALDRPPYLLIAAVCLFLASAADMLDGAVARLGRLQTPLGAVLDSSVDRCSDMVIYLGLIGHFFLQQNFTYTILSAIAMCNAFFISYVKARSETVIRDCTVGFWMRGERSAAVLIAACFGAVPALVWQQAILPALTVLRRLAWTHQVLAAEAAGRPEPKNAPAPGWTSLLKPWRFPRGSLPYDVLVGANITFIIAASHISPVFGPQADPLRRLLGSVG